MKIHCHCCESNWAIATVVHEKPYQIQALFLVYSAFQKGPVWILSSYFLTKLQAKSKKDSIGKIAKKVAAIMDEMEASGQALVRQFIEIKNLC